MSISSRGLCLAILFVLTVCLLKYSLATSCKCVSISIHNGNAVECSLATRQATSNPEMPQCTVVFEQTERIDCSGENVIITNGEYTGAKRMINISCVSEYPIDLDFDGMLPHRSIALSFFRTKKGNGLTNTSTLVVNINSEPEITGRYNIFGINNRSLNTHFYIFAETKESPFLLYEGQQLNAREEANDIIFPCRSFNSNQTIFIRNQEQKRLIQMDKNVRFDPLVGFIFKKHGSINLNGHFECFVENSEDKVVITTTSSGLNSGIGMANDDQELDMNVTGKWAACVSKGKSRLDYRLINMRARNPSEASLKKKCLEGDNECIGKREGSLNGCSFSKYCKTVDFKDGGGILSCFRRNSKTSPDPYQYILGLNQKTYLNPDIQSSSEMLPTNALLAINKQLLFQNFLQIYLFCNKLPSGSTFDMDNPIQKWFETTKEVASYNNYKSEKELLLSENIKYLICSAYIWNSEKNIETSIPISVEGSVTPRFKEVTSEVKFIFNHTIQRLECDVDAKPPSKIEWRKNNQLINGTSNTITAANNSLYFYNAKYKDAGTYTCFATNPLGNATKSFKVTVEEAEATTTNYFITVGIPLVILVLTVLVTVLLLKYYRKKKNGLTKDEIEEFMKGGNPRESNSNCYESHIQCIPYPKDYEIMNDGFQIDNDSVLGSGNYGIVYQGNVSGRNVAIKTLKKYSDISYLRSLLSELKVMIYLKEHPNIVNLIGANTQSLQKGIVFIMVELCPLGSLESYLKKNRVYFRNTKCETNEYTNSAFIKPANENVNTKDFTITDLINWSYQVAKGMEYLASKNVIHGDLAARNVLLYDKSCTKISDFGLSRKMYEYSTYIKKSEELLPWRYMALESLRDLSFSTQSDVWAFGVTLWEIFSLAEVPYVGLTWDVEFIDKIENGLRMAKPKYANEDLYQVMLRCWENDSRRRPAFSDFESIFENVFGV